MFSFFSKKKTFSAEVNGKTITIASKETLLSAALRQNIDFPNSCRVGGCATCKCRLTSGKVRELTDSSYVLSEHELENDFILACQSVPVGDVTVEYEERATKTVSGTVVGQSSLTHDITQLTIKTNTPLSYRPGQYAELELAGLPNIKRSYSFATANSDPCSLTFFIRQVGNGRFSSRAVEEDLMGQSLSVTGPHGDFWLRAGEKDILVVAGGSGLAPIMAMLEQALTNRENRSVTLLFGARQQRDLYKLAEIKSLKDLWPTRFSFVPILSECSRDSDWQGGKGFVTDFIGEYIDGIGQAYLCGPPVMVDKAKETLISLGLNPNDIYADRFTTVTDSVPETA
ncbi:oxidoreductase [Veronia nyctiphanis]|uniref:Oxidoreductase n=1 Tax=Veronia nyctiphanis TaxID=1278244 RepID=A0A4Q0YQ91_9GAMM|nr:2Fe-2S iron-sulfur cluster binding domain-containing protein [Veronia nyctiphanis]RXJ73267.1 oxidoreductase [Veronia nyctiphanis]